MKIRSFYILLLGVFALAACDNAGPQASSTANNEQGAVVREQKAAASGIDAIETAMAADDIPAISVAVMHHGEIVWSESFGMANLETGAPANRETRFRIGSVSKLFTADLAAILAEEGVVDLDADIRSYLPQFPDKNAAITLRQLLGHLGGVRHYEDKDRDMAAPGGPIDMRYYPDAASILAIFAEDPLIAPPGEKYSYTTFGYSLIGLVLEAAADKSYFDLLREKILTPAGINDVAVDDMFAIVPNRAEFYDNIKDYDDFLPAESYGPVVHALPLNSAYKIPGGGLVADAEAVAAFGSLHLTPGFFSETTYADIFTRQKTSAGEELEVGLGWRIAKDEAGRLLYHHSGSQQGGRAHLAVYPEAGISIAILANMNYPIDIRALSDKVAEPFLSQESH